MQEYVPLKAWTWDSVELEKDEWMLETGLGDKGLAKFLLKFI